MINLVCDRCKRTIHGKAFELTKGEVRIPYGSQPDNCLHFAHLCEGCFESIRVVIFGSGLSEQLNKFTVEEKKSQQPSNE